nr:Chain D, RCC1 [Homo sapiens]5E1B_E Chain E, RCC1 [Homo sapiens]
SPKRIA